MTEKQIHFINLRIINLLKDQHKTAQELANVLEEAPLLTIEQRLLSVKTFNYEELKIIADFFNVPFFALVSETYKMPGSTETEPMRRIPKDILNSLYNRQTVNSLSLDGYREYKRSFKNTKEFVKEFSLSLN